MMKEPSNNVFGIILLLGVVVLVVILMKYNQSKSSMPESMRMRHMNGSLLEASGNMLTQSGPSQGSFMDVAQMVPSDNQNSMSPSELLPRDVNSEWSNVNPASNDLKNLNLLSADQMIGINTVSSSLRNANYQERSEPIIPKKDIGPWGNSTIQPDTFRRPLEIGSGE